MKDKIEIYTDGASRGNPGPASYGFIIKTPDGKELMRSSRFIGEATNNEAEYRAVVNALKKARNYTDGKVTLYSDSNLVVNQLSGSWKVKNRRIKKLFQKVRRLEEGFTYVRYVKLPREDSRIAAADALCNRKLNEKLS